eukprot:4972160-Pyramimonas_sp.AAC.1
MRGNQDRQGMRRMRRRRSLRGRERERDTHRHIGLARYCEANRVWALVSPVMASVAAATDALKDQEAE